MYRHDRGTEREECDMVDKILVTGIAGYVGLHVTAKLLRQGDHVVGTVRSAASAERARAALGAVAPLEQLTIVEADLLSDAGWAEAMSGVRFVLHVASPFVLAEPKNPDELIAPAVEGTRRVLAAAQRAGVERVVMTSSVVAISAGKPSGRYGTGDWSDVTAPIGAYALSKTLAEKAAWDAVASDDIELVVINPGFILGPPLGATGDGQSESMIRDLVKGKVPMIPDVAMGMVDVRDIARLHVAALRAPTAAGKRFIAATEEPISMAQVAAILRNAGYTKVPTRKAPNAAIRLMALFDREAKGMVPQLGKRVAYDTQETYDGLQWQPTPLETTIREMAAALAR